MTIMKSDPQVATADEKIQVADSTMIEFHSKTNELGEGEEGLFIETESYYLLRDLIN